MQVNLKSVFGRRFLSLIRENTCFCGIVAKNGVKTVQTECLYIFNLRDYIFGSILDKGEEFPSFRRERRIFPGFVL